jgi:hypothetical protein
VDGTGSGSYLVENFGEYLGINNVREKIYIYIYG